VLSIIAIISVLAGIGIARIDTQTGFRTFLGEKSPDVLYLDEFLGRFGGGFPLLIAYSCDGSAPCETVFDMASLEMAHNLHKSILVLNGVQNVYTPADSELLLPTEEGFEVRTLYGAKDLDVLKSAAAIDPLWERMLVSQAGKVGAIVIDFSSSEASVQKSVTVKARELLRPYEKMGYEFRLVGEAVDFVVAPDAFNEETQKVMPVMVGVMVCILAFLFRSAVAVGISLTTMGLASLWAQGAMGILGWPVDAMTQNIPTIVLVVGICNAVHILSRFSEESRTRCIDTRAEREDVLMFVVRDIGRSCFITSLTTAFAFAAFLTSSFMSFQHFGCISAFGVLATLLLTFSLLPILVAHARPGWIRSVKASTFWEDFTEVLVDIGSEFPRRILVGGAILTAVFAYGASQINVETNHYTLLGRDNPVVHWANWVEDNLRAPESIELELILPPGQSLDDPLALKEVDKVSQFLETEFNGVGPVHSVLAPIRRVYFLLNGSIPGYDRLPEDDISLSEVFLFMPSSAVSNWLTLDRRHVRLSAEAVSLPTGEQNEIVKELEKYLSTQLPYDWTYGLTGSLPIFASMMNMMLKTQVQTFILAFVAVWFCLWIYFRSITVATLGMFPNVLPVLMMLGTLGYWDIPLDVEMTMTAAIVLGLAVDDTVHLLAQYQRRASEGVSPSEAMRGALTHVGRSVVTTSIALSISFLCLTFLSSFEAAANFGLMAAISIFTALVADLLVVPALVHAAPNFVMGRWAEIWKTGCLEVEETLTLGE